MSDPLFATPLVSPHDVTAWTAAARLGSAVGFGIIIALLHRLFRRIDDRPDGLGTTLVLLCIIVALITVAIGDSAARAFGLVGALSVVRFRTTVSDTRDTAFVIFSVAVGLAVGAGFFTAAAVSIPIVTLACGVIEVMVRRHGQIAVIRIRALTTAEGNAAMSELRSRGIRRFVLQQANAGRKSPGVELTYRVWLDPEADPAVILEALQTRPGVTKASWSIR